MITNKVRFWIVVVVAMNLSMKCLGILFSLTLCTLWRSMLSAQGFELKTVVILCYAGLTSTFDSKRSLSSWIPSHETVCLSSGGDHGKVRMGEIFTRAQQWMPNFLTRIWVWSLQHAGSKWTEKSNLYFLRVGTQGRSTYKDPLTFKSVKEFEYLWVRKNKYKCESKYSLENTRCIYRTFKL